MKRSVVQSHEFCTLGGESFDAGMTTGNPGYGRLLLHSDSCAEVVNGRCLVSFKLLQFPSANEHPYDARSDALGELDGFLGGTGFLSSWLGDDNDSDPQRQGVHWVAIAGPAIAFMISRGFWAGAGVRVARALR